MEAALIIDFLFSQDSANSRKVLVALFCFALIKINTLEQCFEEAQSQELDQWKRAAGTATLCRQFLCPTGSPGVPVLLALNEAEHCFPKYSHFHYDPHCHYHHYCCSLSHPSQQTSVY